MPWRGGGAAAAGGSAGAGRGWALGKGGVLVVVSVGGGSAAGRGGRLSEKPRPPGSRSGSRCSRKEGGSRKVGGSPPAHVPKASARLRECVSAGGGAARRARGHGPCEGGQEGTPTSGLGRPAGGPAGGLVGGAVGIAVGCRLPAEARLAARRWRLGASACRARGGRGRGGARGGWRRTVLRSSRGGSEWGGGLAAGGWLPERGGGTVGGWLGRRASHGPRGGRRQEANRRKGLCHSRRQGLPAREDGWRHTSPRQ